APASRTTSGREFAASGAARIRARSEEHTSELQSRSDLVCRLLLEKKKRNGHDSYICEIKAVMAALKNIFVIHYPFNHNSRSSFLHRSSPQHIVLLFFFFNDPATTEIYTLSLHDALPILGDPALVFTLEQRADQFTSRAKCIG